MADMLKELQVLNDVAHELTVLEKDEQRRVIVWLADFFDVYADDIFDYDGLDDFGFNNNAAIEAANYDVENVAAADEPLTWKSFYERVAPKTAIQKIATAAYWLETEENKESWKSFETNKLLKQIDIKVSSVSGTLALDAKRDDPMTETLSKSGDSMQARKTFKLTSTGRSWVEDRL